MGGNPVYTHLHPHTKFSSSGCRESNPVYTNPNRVYYRHTPSRYNLVWGQDVRTRWHYSTPLIINLPSALCHWDLSFCWSLDIGHWDFNSLISQPHRLHLNLFAVKQAHQPSRPFRIFRRQKLYPSASLYALSQISMLPQILA